MSSCYQKNVTTIFDNLTPTLNQDFDCGANNNFDNMSKNNYLWAILAMLVFSLSWNTQAAIIPSSSSITPEKMQEMLNQLDVAIFNSTQNSTLPGVPQLRKFLRLAFHDCTGGCDARVNLASTQNRGLQGVVRFLDRVYNNQSYIFRSSLSRPDFWVLCELRALAYGIRGGSSSGEIPILGESFVHFKIGRANNSGPSNVDSIIAMPDGLANWTNTVGPTTVLEGLKVGLKDYVSEKDIVALLGLHNVGTAVQNNSGFNGPWGQNTDRNRINNNMFKFILGKGMGSDFSFVQTPSLLNVIAGTNEINYTSPPPTFNKLQWTRAIKPNPNIQQNTPNVFKILLNVDMGMYHDFKSSVNGAAPGKYCPQLNNNTLYDCSKVDRSYMPLSRNAQTVFNYANSPITYYRDVINAMMRLTSVPSESDNSNTWIDFRPKFVCVNGQLKCLGDVLFQNCQGYTNKPPC